jgi:hypothetical protein
VEDMGNIYKILVGKHERKGLLVGKSRPTWEDNINIATCQDSPVTHNNETE